MIGLMHLIESEYTLVDATGKRFASHTDFRFAKLDQIAKFIAGISCEIVITKTHRVPHPVEKQLEVMVHNQKVKEGLLVDTPLS